MKSPKDFQEYLKEIVSHINSESLESSNTGTDDCFCNSLSLETIPEFNLSANARKSTSFGCSGSSSNAREILSEYSENGTKIIVFCNFSINSSNSCEDSLVFSNISDLCLLNSVNANLGEYNECLSNNFFINSP